MVAPTATGNLASTPFCELLVYALTRHLSGSLVFECPDRSKHALLFEQGAPVKGRVDHSGTRLGQVLLALGSVQPEALRKALEEDGAELLGHRLFARGAISPEALGQGLSEQLRRQVSWLSRVPAATAFAYFDGSNLLEDWGGEPLSVDPLACIWSAADAYAPPQRVSAALAALADKTLRLHPDARVSRFGFPKQARAVFDVLRVKPQSLAELTATGLVERELLHKLIYALVLTRHLDMGQPPLGVAPGVPRSGEAPASRRKFTPPPSSVSRLSLPRSRPVLPAHSGQPAAAAVPAAPPVSPAPAPAHPVEPVRSAQSGRATTDSLQTGRFLTREEIEAKVQSFEQLSHYELLELPLDAPSEQVGQAFAALARRWHPDRLNPQYGELRDGVTRVFARMTEASRVLGNPASRSAYDASLETLRTEQDEQEKVEAVLRAAEAFQRAEILLKKRDLANAEKLARSAFEGDPDQPEYAALFAWIRARRPGASEQDLTEALGLLKKAVAKQQDNVKIHFYLAGVLKLTGQEAAALREFRFVAERDPSNVEAAREIRLSDLRRSQSQATAPASGGLFSRFFKR